MVYYYYYYYYYYYFIHYFCGPLLLLLRTQDVAQAGILEGIPPPPRGPRGGSFFVNYLAQKGKIDILC